MKLMIKQSPYKLDVIVDDNNNFYIYALTKKNIDFIKGIVKIDIMGKIILLISFLFLS